MNKKIIAAVAVLILIIVSGYTYSEINSPQQVLIYTTNSGIDLMLQKSAVEYMKTHNVEITWISPGGSGATVQKVIQEMDNPQADICVASIPSHYGAKDAGALEVFIPENAQFIPDAFKDSEGYFTGWFAFYNCWIYNPDAVPNPPQTLNDLLDPTYAGKIVYPDPATSGNGIRFVASLVHILGEDEAFGFLQDLEPSVIQHPSLVQSSMIDRGEIWIAVSDSSVSLTDYFQGDMDNQLMFFLDEGTIAGYVGISLVKGGPNPELAKEFLNYLVSKEAQIHVATEGYGIPVRTDVSLPSDLADAFQPAFDANVLDLDWLWMNENQQHWKDRWVEEVIG